MKTKVAFFILFLSLCVSAQTHRFTYDVEFRKDSTSQVTTKQNYHLDITGDDILYYSRDYFVADSLIKNNIPFPADLKLSTSTILKHKKGSSTFNEYDLLESTVLDLQTKDVQIWTLTNEKKQLDNLTLQKATTTWGGRNWIAWFAKDIPFQDGPYKFKGLPGLIVKIEDETKSHLFELKGIKNLNYDFIYPDNSFDNKIKLSNKKFIKTFKENRKYPAIAMKLRYPKAEDAEMIKEIEKYFLEEIKKDNNIIEIDLIK